MGVYLIKPCFSDDLAMEVLENLITAKRMSDASLIDSLAIILVSHGGIKSPDENDIWDPKHLFKDRLLTWSNAMF